MTNLHGKWIRASKAHILVKRDRMTVYRWIRDGRVRTIQPGRYEYAHIPDLLQAEKTTRRRVRKSG